MQEKELDVERVTFAYEEGTVPAVQDVSFSVSKGEMVAVLGHNGSGKSTLSKLMNALYLPQNGRVLVCDLDTKDEALVWDIRQKAGMVFQNPDNQIVATVVREDVAFGLENMGVPTEEMIPRVEEALRAVNMTEYAASAPHMLSGGQKQRVAIAGVLAMKPDIMIFDESTAMLDPAGRGEVLNTVRRLNRENNITVLWITHYMEEAALCDRVLVMDHGRLVMGGTPKEVFGQVDAVRKLRLDVPPMCALAEELRKEGMNLPQGILTVEEMTGEVLKCLSK